MNIPVLIVDGAVGAGIHWCALSAGVAEAAATSKGLIGEVQG